MRGRLLAVVVTHFVSSRPTIVDAPPAMVAQLLGGGSMVRMVLDVDAMVWHHVTVDRLLRSMHDQLADVVAVPVWEDADGVVVYAASRCLHGSPPATEATALGLLALGQARPSVADVFCAER